MSPLFAAGAPPLITSGAGGIFFKGLPVTTIGPKPIEEFSDEEVETLEATAVEVPMRVVVAGDTIAVFRDFKDGPAVRDLPVLPLSSGPSMHLMVPDPED